MKPNKCFKLPQGCYGGTSKVEERDARHHRIHFRTDWGIFPTLKAEEHEVVSDPSGPPVTWQENTALLSSCGLAGMPQQFSLRELGGKECSVGLHSKKKCFSIALRHTLVVLEMH